MTNARVLRHLLFSGAVLCAAFMTACSTDTVAASSKVQQTLTPGEIWDKWYQAATNPLVNPKPDFEQEVLKPMSRSFPALTEQLANLNDGNFSMQERRRLQLLVLRYVIAVPNKTTEEEQECLNLLGKYAQVNADFQKLLLNYNQKSSK